MTRIKQLIPAVVVLMLMSTSAFAQVATGTGTGLSGPVQQLLGILALGIIEVGIFYMGWTLFHSGQGLGGLALIAAGCFIMGDFQTIAGYFSSLI